MRLRGLRGICVAILLLLIVGIVVTDTVDAKDDGKWKMATDEDFKGEKDGEFVYIGDGGYIELPHEIKGEKITSYALKNGGHRLTKGTMKMKPVTSINKIEGTGTVPKKGMTTVSTIDEGKVELVTSKDARGEYEIVFPKGALEVGIDPTKVRKGTYESTLTWDLIQAP